MTIQIDWIIFSQVLTAIVALAGLGLAIYSIVRKPPKISLEKVLANKDEEKLIDFVFYLDNIGETAVTIKSIQFYNSRRFMPKVKLASVKNRHTIVDKVGGGIDIEKIQGSEKYLEFPMHLLPNTSIKLHAQLEFPDEEHRNASIVNGQIHFNIIIKHSRGEIDERI